MDLELADMVVLVTGASGGIGRALASVFARENCTLILHAGQHRSALEQFVAGMPWRDRASVDVADVRDARAVDELFERSVLRWGRVDICVANAGIWPAEDVPLHAMPIDRIRTVIETNLLGAMWTARAFLRALAPMGPRTDGRGASLCFIGSTAGRFGERHHVEYAASKAALYGLVRSLKNEVVELDPYARVNMVEPGWTVTEMARPALEDQAAVCRALATMPVRQLARPEDVARAVAFLASPAAARHISGEILTVAGGMEGRQRWTTKDIDLASVRARVE